MSSLHATELETEKKDNDSIKARQKWVIVPVAAYGSETGVILGASVFYFPPTSANSIRNSSLDIIVFGTIKGQYFITLIPDLYIDNGRYLDRDLFALQSEFRYPIKGKFSGTVFAEVAQVASDIHDINFDNLII